MKVVGVAKDVKKAEKVKSRNSIEKVSYVSSDVAEVEKLFREMQNFKKIAAVVNQFEIYGRCEYKKSLHKKLTFSTACWYLFSVSTTSKFLRNMAALSSIVVITPLTSDCFEPLVDLLKPTKSALPIFEVTHCCIAEKVLNAQLCYIILLERN